MSFRLQRTGLVVVLKLSEGFISEREVRKMREAVRKELVNGNDRLVVDLGITTHITSMVIGALVEMYTSYHNIGGHILFANPSPPAQMLLHTLKLDQAFEIVASVNAAVDRLDTRKLRDSA